MMAIKRIVTGLTLVIFVAIITTGCMHDNSMNTTTDVSSDNILQTSNGPVQVLSMGESGLTLDKVTSVTKFIRAAQGGTVYLSHNNPRNRMTAEITLQILPKALDKNKNISITLDDEDFVGNMDVVFGAHGTVFAKPAILNVYANGLDFSGVDVAALQIYYYEPDTGSWEPMQAEFIGADAARGEMKIINAQIPHFSRYAVAWSR
jgi:hypothetical protein